MKFKYLILIPVLLSGTVYASAIDECGIYFSIKEYSKALPYCQEACNMNGPVNDGLGCGILGSLYYNGRGVKQDYSQAKTYYEKACNLNEGLGCSSLGVLYYNGHVETVVLLSREK